MNAAVRAWLGGMTPQSASCLASGYGLADLRKDLLAGLTVGVVALPLAMAFAIASGLGPERGLFTGIVAGLLISIFSGSRHQIGGPTGAFVVIVAGVVARHGYDGLALATLMAGVMLLVLAVSGLGALVQYIPYPVTTGFTTGIAVIIFSTQVKDLLGLPTAQSAPDFLHTWAGCAAALPGITFWPAALGLGGLLLLVAQRRWAPRLPGPLLLIIVAAAVTATLNLPVQTVGTRFGDIPGMLPAPSLPAFSLQRLQSLLPDAMSIAALAAIESLLSAVVADGMTGTQHRPSAELLGQGLANIGAAMFGGLPATGAIARTATNIRAGAVSPVSGVIHALTLLAIMLAAAPLARLIPLPALAAILVLVAYNMSEIDRFRSLFRGPRSDAAVLLTTFVLTVLVDLNVAIQVGFLLAALAFMKRMVDVAGVRRVGWLGHEDMPPSAMARRLGMPSVEIFEIHGPFFFGSAHRLKLVLDQMERPPKAFILRLRHVPAMDATGLHSLRLLFEKCRKQGTTLILSGVHTQPRRALVRSGLAHEIGLANIRNNIHSALERAHEIVNPAASTRADPSSLLDQQGC